MSEEIRTCKQCGASKPMTAEFWHRQGSSYRPRCKTCIKENNRRYIESNAEIIKQRKKEYYAKNRDETHERRKGYFESRKKVTSVYRETLDDRYIKALINHHYGISFKSISEDFIEIKRQQVISRRILRQFKKWRTHYESSCSNV
jgi:hypothetical protein